MRKVEEVLRDLEAVLNEFHEADCGKCDDCVCRKGTRIYVAGVEKDICDIAQELRQAIKRDDGGKKGAK